MAQIRSLYGEEKCHFGLDTVKCFGHIFSERGKEIDPKRKETNQVMGGFEGLREVELFRGSGFVSIHLL